MAASEILVKMQMRTVLNVVCDTVGYTFILSIIIIIFIIIIISIIIIDRIKVKETVIIVNRIKLEKESGRNILNHSTP